ncbi:hypothetical protein ABIB35_000854 [Arthrobacter sp. UYP6]
MFASGVIRDFDTCVHQGAHDLVADRVGFAPTPRPDNGAANSSEEERAF